MLKSSTLLSFSNNWHLFRSAIFTGQLNYASAI